MNELRGFAPLRVNLFCNHSQVAFVSYRVVLIDVHFFSKLSKALLSVKPLVIITPTHMESGF